MKVFSTCGCSVWSQTHRVRRLVLSAVQLLAVVEDVVIRGVEAGLDAVPHHLAGSGWRLELLDLSTEEEKIRLGLAKPAEENTVPYLHPEEGDAG